MTDLDKLLERHRNYVHFGDNLANSSLKLLVILYADYTVILRDSGQGMKQALSSLDRYCTDWKLIVNCSKTKMIVFSKEMVHTGSDDSREQYSASTLTQPLIITAGLLSKGETELLEHTKRAEYSLVGTCRKLALLGETFR